MCILYSCSSWAADPSLALKLHSADPTTRSHHPPAGTEQEKS